MFEVPVQTFGVVTVYLSWCNFDYLVHLVNLHRYRLRYAWICNLVSSDLLFFVSEFLLAHLQVLQDLVRMIAHVV